MRWFNNTGTAEFNVFIVNTGYAFINIIFRHNWLSIGHNPVDIIVTRGMLHQLYCIIMTLMQKQLI